MGSQSNRPPEEVPTEHAPERVFVSYAHETDELDAVVLSLTQQLRCDGVDALCDQYVQAPAEGWPRWMEKQIEGAHFVLIVCTDTYRRRLPGDNSRAVGKGVIWEATLVYQLIYNSSTVNLRFIPVLFPGATPDDIPTPLQSATYYSLVPPFSLQDRSYEDLYRRITGQPRLQVPTLGPRQALRIEPCKATREERPNERSNRAGGTSSDLSNESVPEVPTSEEGDRDTSLSLANLSTIIGLVANIIVLITFVLGFSVTTRNEVFASAAIVGLLALSIAIWSPVHRRVALIVLLTLLLSLAIGFTAKAYVGGCPKDKTCVVVAPFDAYTGDKDSAANQFSNTILDGLQELTHQYTELQPSKSNEIINDRASKEDFSDAERLGATLVFWGRFSVADPPHDGTGTLKSHYRTFNIDPRSLPPDVILNQETFSQADWKQNLTPQNDVKERTIYLTKVVLGIVASQNENYPAAIDRLSDALARVPSGEKASTLATIYLLRGEAYAHTRMFDQAVQDYKAVLDHDHDNAAACREMGAAYFAENKFDEAIAEFDICIGRNPADKAALDERGLAFLRRATGQQGRSDEASKERDLASSEADLDKAIGLDGQFATAFNHRGLLNLAKQQLERALADFDAAVRQSKPQNKSKSKADYIEAQENRGRVLFQLNRWQDSLQAYSDAISVSPQNTIALTERGAGYSSLKDYRSAIADFTAVLNCRPSESEPCSSTKVAVYEARGLAHAQLNEFDDAVSDFGQAIVREDNETKLASLYYSTAGFLTKLGETDSALANLSKAIALNSKLAQAYYDRAGLYKKTGDIDNASKDLRMFMTLTTDEATKASAKEQLAALTSLKSKTR